MSKKNRRSWRKEAPAPLPSPAAITEPRALASASAEIPAVTSPSAPSDFSPISPARLAANRANAQLSTGARTPEGKAKSSQNAVKSRLTGRTVLLPTDDRNEYAALLADIQKDLKPVGSMECELVQIVVDCFWRLRRIQELEHALYTHGEAQFAEAFAGEPEENRRSLIVLETHLTYQKELRNLHIQEARIDRKRTKARAELSQLRAERLSPQEDIVLSESDVFSSDAELFAAVDASHIPPSIASALAKRQAAQENGFVFSNSNAIARSEYSAACVDPLIEPKAA